MLYIKKGDKCNYKNIGKNKHPQRSRGANEDWKRTKTIKTTGITEYLSVITLNVNGLI
jgi:hypothetical protein